MTPLGELMEMTIKEIGDMHPDRVRSIFRRVAMLEQDVPVCGDELKWLVHFSHSLAMADADNFAILHPAACMLIAKYGLHKQLE